MGRLAAGYGKKVEVQRKDILVGGWATPLKNMKVTWDDEIPNIWENKTDVPNHQPVYVCLPLKQIVAT